MDIVNFYEAKGLVRRVDSNRAPDDVWADVQRLFSTEV